LATLFEFNEEKLSFKKLL